MYNSSWWFDSTYFWRDYPVTDYTKAFKYYYLLQFAYWLQQIFVLQIEAPRKDYRELVAHHINTLLLISLSYACNFTRVGNAVFICMDLPDSLLALAKTLNYVLPGPICNLTFVAMTISWLYTRVYLYGHIIWSTYTEPDLYVPVFKLAPLEGHWFPYFAKYIILGLMIGLYLLILFWTAMIFKVFYKMAFKAEAKDVRSDDEDEDELDEVPSEGADHEPVEIIRVPYDNDWLDEIDFSDIPNLPIRPVGSGICQNTNCDDYLEDEHDRCFETCGSRPSPSSSYGCPLANQWALTFDDGPSNLTNWLLDILDEYDVRATFCLQGSHVKKYPDVVRRAVHAGHQIASHTYSHSHLMSLTNEEIVFEIKATEEAIWDAAGVRPRYVRPPFGEVDDRVRAVLEKLGYKVLMWNVDPTDYKVFQLADAAKRIMGSFENASNGIDTDLNLHNDPGFISLQHDLYSPSIAQVPHIIRMLKEKGFDLITAAACQNDEPMQAQAIKSNDTLEAVSIVYVPILQAASAIPESTTSSSSYVHAQQLQQLITVSLVLLLFSVNLNLP
ncbi:chitin deacetylase [Apophysomyces sp. BC1034]|nr:chitin deacetylase [Apophysomyces sp. BC1021]KAG0184387.1 chitin deacetylase [Apophysomyces sp. BC1034]